MLKGTLPPVEFTTVTDWAGTPFPPHERSERQTAGAHRQAAAAGHTKRDRNGLGYSTCERTHGDGAVVDAGLHSSVGHDRNSRRGRCC